MKTWVGRSFGRHRDLEEANRYRHQRTRMTIQSCVQIFISLFVLVNPLEGIPFFLARTGGASAATRATIAQQASIAVTVILLVSSVIGAKVLALFGIHLPAFQVGGGIILFLIALQMALVGVSSEK